MREGEATEKGSCEWCGKGFFWGEGERWGRGLEKGLTECVRGGGEQTEARS